MNDKLETIKRKAVQIFSVEDLKRKMQSEKKLTIKLGADPSRPDLHIGHSVVLRVLKAFQDMGHEVVFVVGDFTGMIGDPSGKNKTRPALSFEEKVATDFIFSHNKRIIINICDASNLQRNLYLTLSLMELNVPIILIVNQIDKRKICNID